MIFQEAVEVANDKDMTFRRNDYKGFTLSSDSNPDFDYKELSGYQFKKMSPDEFEELIQDCKTEWPPDEFEELIQDCKTEWSLDMLQCPDCEEDYCTCD